MNRSQTLLSYSTNWSTIIRQTLPLRQNLVFIAHKREPQEPYLILTTLYYLVRRFGSMLTALIWLVDISLSQKLFYSIGLASRQRVDNVEIKIFVQLRRKLINIETDALKNPYRLFALVRGRYTCPHSTWDFLPLTHFKFAILYVPKHSFLCACFEVIFVLSILKNTESFLS